MKEPKKAFVKIIYSDFSSEEIEIPLDIAMKITDKEKESDLMNLVSSLDLSACSKRISTYIQMLWITAELFMADEENTPAEQLSHAFMKKRITLALKAIAENKKDPGSKVHYATVEDKVCRQMEQSKDELTDRVIQFFTAAIQYSADNAVSSPESLYRYVVDNNYLSNRVANSGYVDEGEILRKELFKIAEKLQNN